MKLKNIGPKTEIWLRELGILSREDLEKWGSVAVYVALKRAGRKVSLVLVYALEGALLEMHWNQLPLELKEDLKQRCQEAMLKP